MTWVSLHNKLRRWWPHAHSQSLRKHRLWVNINRHRKAQRSAITPRIIVSRGGGCESLPYILRQCFKLSAHATTRIRFQSCFSCKFMNHQPPGCSVIPVSSQHLPVPHRSHAHGGWQGVPCTMVKGCPLLPGLVLLLSWDPKNQPRPL